MEYKGTSGWDLEQFEKMSKEFMRLTGEIQNLLTQHVKDKTNPMPMLSVMSMGKTFMNAYQELLKNPRPAQEATEKMFKDFTHLWQSMFLLPGEQREGLVEVHNDKRFRDPLWAQTPYSAFILQLYLIYSHWAESIADDVEGLDDTTRRKLKFYSRQMVDALSPSNFAWVNPIVMKKTMETHGENLIKGMSRFLEDLQSGTSLMNIQNTDRDAFQLGKNLASTPGKVVFQNHLIQLIQYEPQTQKVHKTPVLVVPPWINKYYILDLQPKNSFVNWLVGQGHTVFMISWVNPGKDMKNTDFEDYLKYGSMEAMRVIREITGEPQTNLIGFCLGGISLTALIGYLQKDAKKTIKSLTLMASPIDFSQAGELTLFMEPEFLGLVANKLEDVGLLDGAAMGATFNMLRANDLIWSAFINNYLLANEPQQFDMLFWNADHTNLPSKMFHYYIDEMYVKNALIKPGGMEMMGKKIDISKSDVPMFIVGTHDDHISPWKSMYSAIKLFKASVHFVLGASGHVAGIINHPDAKKYGHWHNDDYTLNAEQWLQKASHSTDSWWLAWKDWVEIHQGESVDANQRIPGGGKYKTIEDAPGSYVRVSSAQALKK